MNNSEFNVGEIDFLLICGLEELIFFILVC